MVVVPVREVGGRTTRVHNEDSSRRGAGLRRRGGEGEPAAFSAAIGPNRED